MFTTKLVNAIGSAYKNDQKGAIWPYVVSTYVVFLAVAGFVYFKIAAGEFSSILTIAAIFQILAFFLLGVQVVTGSASGVSAKMLQLDAIAIASRLCATTCFSGYIPLDVTGDFLYQAFDGLSLVIALWLIRCVLNAQRESDEATEDGLRIIPFLVVCFVLSCILHADLDERPLFDSLWMNSWFVATIALVPQLWMMTHRTGGLSALTGQFVAVKGFSHALVGVYMWVYYDEITSKPWIGSFNHAGPTILGAHVVHLMFLTDFAFAYFWVKDAAEPAAKPVVGKSWCKTSVERFIAV